MIVFSAIMPHPPMSVAGIGSQKDFTLLKKTLNSFDELRIKLESADPDTIIIISPHAHLEKYSFVINSASDLKGDLVIFGNEKPYLFKNDMAIANRISYACLMNELEAKMQDNFLDYGAIIPLHHLTKNIKPKIVHLSFSLMSYDMHYRYGQIIQSVIENSKYTERVAIIASGDLSHKLSKNSPAGYFPGAEKFDHDFMRFLGAYDLASLMGLEEEFVQDSAECGVRSIMILLGILHGKNKRFKMLSYQAPSGIGYLSGYFD